VFGEMDAMLKIMAPDVSWYQDFIFAVLLKLPGVVDVRVRGALGVVQLEALGDMYWIRQRFAEEGCWVRPFGDVIYLMPSFTMDAADLSHLTNAVCTITGEWSDRRHDQ